MDPPRQSHNQPGRNSPVPPRRLATLYTSDDQNRSSVQSSSHYSQQPSLPSIRQLHPYLPPSGMSQQETLPDASTSAYSYPPPTYPIASGSGDLHSGHSTQSHSNVYGRTETLESELEGDADQQGPAKKKRRRQALSCNGEHIIFNYQTPYL
ncbi:hypothetical protein SERLA73DRAFT_77364 [Serpula lacrymans var. lacrymans S7.3]|uniref:Uncharacterized protein n=1 Tax=Serpula lacrymans var. lacrymans (strain S7.3) TaxID=936435 RepID=F8Q9S0_SERL3|nr:hypothetical protein SERLA73DRAFT_77364 [Serpula lacrymans var. lacrymans S7.3]